MPQKKIPKGDAPRDEMTEFAKVLQKHLDALDWSREDMAEGSKRYPLIQQAMAKLSSAKLSLQDLPNFKDGISHGQAYGIMAKRENKDWRPPSRQMINVIAHALAAAYEHKSPEIYSRQNVEALLEELLKAAGFASHEWINDRWDDIIDAPLRRARGEEAGRPVRVGYFSWPGMTDVSYASDGRIVGVTGHSKTLVDWLLRALRLPVLHESVPLTVTDLFDKGLFLRVDLVAPFVGVPARRFAIGYSKAIGGWRVGQNFLAPARVAETRSDFRKLPIQGLKLHYVQGGISELIVDELDLKPDALVPCESFQEALERVMHSESKSNLAYFVGDSVTCDAALLKYPGKLATVLDHHLTMACPLVFGLPQRTEVLATVNQALDLLETLRRDEFQDLVPNGISREAWEQHLLPSKHSQDESPTTQKKTTTKKSKS